MSTGKTFFGKIIAFLGHLFSGLFHVAINTYDQLPAEIKDAIAHGTGVVALINEMLEKSPAEIRAAIALKYPNLKEAELEASLISVLHTLNLAEDINSLEDAIGKIQDWLSKHTEGAWAQVSHAIGVGISHALAPQGTKLATITSVIEAVFQAFHK
jgi:hypothetical protein